MACPRFPGHLNWRDHRVGRGVRDARTKLPDFRRRAVELARLREKPVAAVAKDLRLRESWVWMIR